MKLSLLVVACNEEHRLEACIASCRPVVDEVVVVVQESTDGTLALAQRLADQVVEDQCHGISEPSRPLGLAACRGDWVLTLDADEELTGFGQAILPPLCDRKEIDFYRLRRLTSIEGQIIENRACGRLFRRHLVSIPLVNHSEFQPLTERHKTVPGAVVILHNKTWAEQHIDNDRYAKDAEAGKKFG